MIAAYIDHYHHRPTAGSTHRTPAEVKQTWDDADQALQKAAGLNCQHAQGALHSDVRHLSLRRFNRRSRLLAAKRSRFNSMSAVYS